MLEGAEPHVDQQGDGADSFSDGGCYLEPRAALEHARALLSSGAHAVDLGPASSHPDSRQVPATQEIERLRPVLDGLLAEGAAVSVDSCLPETQLYAVGRGVSYLNDICGFPDRSMYPVLARAACKLVVMHSVQRAERATREQVDPAALPAEIDAFFAERIDALCAAGVEWERLILDPGMGFFLGSDAGASVRVLRGIGDLRRRFGLPLLVSVSRKSFLGTLTGAAVSQRGPATLAAELYAAAQGVDYIRTHDVAALRDALAIARILDGGGEAC